MKKGFFISLILLSLLIAAMAGCGSGNSGSQTALSTLDASETCIRCHTTENNISPVTGMNIVDEWKLSTHNTRNGAGCRDCHGHATGHPNSCGECHGGSTSVTATFHNPDSSGQCYKCHGVSASIFPLGAGRKHFDVYTTVDVVGARVPSATFVGTQNTYKCTGCHSPHNSTLLTQHREWEESGHGEVNVAPWIHYDFKTMNPCNRCHTTTGFVKYIKTNDSSPWATVSADKSREMLRCNGCHLDYTWKRIDARTPGLSGVKVPYGTFSSAILTYGKTADNTTSTTYQDTGDSNICINCHSGLTSGRIIRNNPALLAKTAQNSHYFAAAGTLYGTLGYEYRPHKDYQLIYNGTLIFEHAELGLKNVTYRGHVINLGTTRGPCVACHMSDKGHSLKVVAVDTNVPGLDPRSPRAAINGTITDFPANGSVCSKCHAGSLSLSFGTPNNDIRLLKTEYMDRLAELEAALAAQGIAYDPDKVPYFWPVAVTNHNDRAQAFGSPTAIMPTTWPNEGTLGAAYNLNLCFRDPGGYAHNHRYTARLIYDSLDFLDDGLLNESYSPLAARTAGFPTGRPF